MRCVRVECVRVEGDSMNGVCEWSMRVEGEDECLNRGVRGTVLEWSDWGVCCLRGRLQGLPSSYS